MKQILIFHEKHGDRYFDASTKEAIDAACRKILKERLTNGYGWYDVYEPSYEAEHTQEQIDKLPEAFKYIAQRMKDSNEAKRKAYAKELAWVERLKTLLKTPREQTKIFKYQGMEVYESFKYIKDRADGEYEGFTFEKLEKCDDE